MMKRIGDTLQTISKVILILSALLLPISNWNTKSVIASSISSEISEYILKPGDFDLGTIEFTSTDKEVVNINVSVKSYDPQNESFLDTQPFIGISKSKYSVKPNETVQIEYAVSIPQNQPEGSFFNVIAIEPEISTEKVTGNINVNIRNGYGALFAFHIEGSETNIDQIFLDKSDTQIIVQRRGFPFLSKMSLLYTYKNDTNFVFRPQGEIRVLNKNGKQAADRVEINPEGKAIYPGKTLEVKREVNAWEDLDTILDSKTITARTYNGFTENYLTNQVEVSIKEPLFLLGALSLIIILSIVALISKALLRGKKKSKQESAE